MKGRGGRRLGEIERLVVDEAAHRVTHVVVDDHLVGVRRLREGPEGLVADLDRDDLQRLPKADHDQVGAPGDYWRPPLGWTMDNFLRITGALIGQAPYVPPVHFDPDLEDVHEITEGSPVWSGYTRLGHVERLLTGEDGSVSELVVRDGGIRGRHRRVPASRITEVVGNNVHTDIAPAEFQGLPEYRE